MRHFLGATLRLGVLSPTPVQRLAGRMPMATLPRLLVPTSRPKGLLPATLRRAQPAAVPLTAIAPGADRHQAATAHARKQPVVWPHRQPSGCRGARRRSKSRRYLQPETRRQRRAFWTGPGGVTAKVRVTLLGLRRLRQLHDVVTQAHLSCHRKAAGATCPRPPAG